MDMSQEIRRLWLIGEGCVQVTRFREGNSVACTAGPVGRKRIPLTGTVIARRPHTLMTPLPRFLDITLVSPAYKSVSHAYPGNSGPNNSLRHCVGACAARRHCGPNCSWAIFMHEMPEEWAGDSLDVGIDMFNNQRGFDVAGKKGICSSPVY